MDFRNRKKYIRNKWIDNSTASRKGAVVVYLLYTNKLIIGKIMNEITYIYIVEGIENLFGKKLCNDPSAIIINHSYGFNSWYPLTISQLNMSDNKLAKLVGVSTKGAGRIKQQYLNNKFDKLVQTKRPLLMGDYRFILTDDGYLLSNIREEYGFCFSRVDKNIQELQDYKDQLITDFSMELHDYDEKSHHKLTKWWRYNWS